MFKLSAFADEISPELSEQIRVCKELGITHFELRGVYGKNVLDFDAALVAEVKAKLAEAGLGVAAIGSPIGKVAIDLPWTEHLERFKVAVSMAEQLNAPMIRLFSYYPPKAGGEVSTYREEIMRRFRDKLAYLGGRPITLVHENEGKIYGEGVANCVDLMKTINSPKLRSAFDFANFIVAKENPADNWPPLKPYTTHVHIKDAVMATGKIVPAGEGDGSIGAILTDLHKSGYNGFLSLEPHLSAAGQFSGFSGPDLFAAAANALKKVCADNKLPLAVGK